MDRSISTILRIIEHTRMGHPDMVIAYAKRLVPESEWDTLEELVNEKFNPNAVAVILD